MGSVAITIIFLSTLIIIVYQMDVAATKIKSELSKVTEDSELEAKTRIRRYLQHVGFTPGHVKELPSISTSELCLDTEMLFYLISLNKFDTLSENTNLVESDIPDSKDCRKQRLFSSIYSKIKRSLLHHYRGHQRFNKRAIRHEAERDTIRERLDEKVKMMDFEDSSDYYKGGSPSSVQTVIQSDNLVMITPPGLPTDPKPTTNILEIM